MSIPLGSFRQQKCTSEGIFKKIVDAMIGIGGMD
ncbi:hypothetical protein CCACVL1_03487 [Corchorus capsularis]|uniref:Uncharacterized protein n=1 Tax=Corchorus capsularis TaxID=210143 RepID=A0A1R3JZ10_COCAP|nr:hypothetical protein CCACVL1_03487 [Corchorus capsularis]